MDDTKVGINRRGEVFNCEPNDTNNAIAMGKMLNYIIIDGPIEDQVNPSFDAIITLQVQQSIIKIFIPSFLSNVLLIDEGGTKNVTEGF